MVRDMHKKKNDFIWKKESQKTMDTGYRDKFKVITIQKNKNENCQEKINEEKNCDFKIKKSSDRMI